MTAPRTPDVVDAAVAEVIFAEFAAAGESALTFPADGCYARTHLMVQRLLERGLVAWKVWAFAAGITDLLWANTFDHPDGRVQWSYHVAPILLVRMADHQLQELVFDPVIFDRPVGVDEWKNALHDTPTLVRMPAGDAPLPARGGSGYWPGPDPIEGPDLHARETLEECRRSNP